MMKPRCLKKPVFRLSLAKGNEKERNNVAVGKVYQANPCFFMAEGHLAEYYIGPCAHESPDSACVG